MTTPTFSDPFESFVAPARAYPALWRVIVGVVAWVVLTFAFAIALSAAVTYLAPALVADRAIFDGGTPLGVVSFLGVFMGAFFAVWLVARVLHKRGWRSLMGQGKVARNFAIGAGLFLTLQAINIGVWHLFYDSTPNVSWDVFLAWLPVLVIALIFQTGAEELMFRGYLMQQMAARFRSPIIWMAIPQILFALLHFNPTSYGPITWLIIGVIFILAMLWADLARVTGNLGAAWGWHFANNLIVFGVFGSPGEMDGLALRVTPYDVVDTPPLAYLGFVVMLVLTWAILRRLLRA
ncbi:type II CAAX endopeptidase family protein [Cognatiyoonia sp. IB215182]|uniref:CPBP family intramembrane glutamic endopeptidase n=1 Tax=Cognatiyoonia sp. IB215182 TaxID=3097353 RepID=UPI002A0C55BF|nr:type II CAAX endopeptidase family protein [Cognatiyoonia sp. IB215182]MDX8352684.1 type II CAAX endopeptidase family protein [Cognatiyoonia sp. IB215182]